MFWLGNHRHHTTLLHSRCIILKASAVGAGRSVIARAKVGAASHLFQMKSCIAGLTRVRLVRFAFALTHRHSVIAAAHIDRTRAILFMVHGTRVRQSLVHAKNQTSSCSDPRYISARFTLPRFQLESSVASRAFVRLVRFAFALTHRHSVIAAADVDQACVVLFMVHAARV